ncbi:CPBP family intramembrane glutamic endopeptidase [Furfurilactobacillus sp. WILCCON 0119]|uniref:CPBP family intramembrane glutamic endopeptidase n=1 Tax=Furfurilactobacillus entadae TaxID=2922307 RepID=UPI0035E67D3A
MSKYYKVFVTWLVFIALVLTENYWTPAGFLKNPAVSIIFDEIILILVVVALNVFWLKQEISIKPTVSIKEQLAVTWLPLVAYLFLNITAVSFLSHIGRSKPIGTLLLFYAAAVLVGIAEEYLFRGLIISTILSSFNKITYKSVMYAAIISSLTFGLTHGINLTSQSVLATVVQAASAAMTGFLSAAILLRTGSILWPMLFHAMNDGMTFIAAGIGDSKIVSLSPVYLVPLLLGFWLLRRSKFFDKNGDSTESFTNFSRKITDHISN